MQRGVWREGAKSEAQWRASLRDYAGALMAEPVDAIGPGDVLALLAPIWNEKRETARRVRQRIGAVMRWSVAEGHRGDNPVDAIGAALPKNAHRRKHHKALPYEEVGQAIRTIRGTAAHVSTRLALEFLILTACRSGEVRGALWSEIDLDSATWTVPAGRMKSAREHRVPLSLQALEVLAEAREWNDESPLVFPSLKGRVMSSSTLSKLLRENRVGAVPHGFRSSFRIGRWNARARPRWSPSWRWRMWRKTRRWRRMRGRISSSVAASSWWSGRITSRIKVYRKDGSVDRIQRRLRASLEADPVESRERTSSHFWSCCRRGPKVVAAIGDRNP